jgi:hypothetical protein
MNEPHRSPINPATTGTDSNPGSLNRRHLLALSGSAGAAMALAHSSSAAAATNAMAPFVFVEDFGAAGTGTVNDADAIQAALNSGAHVVYGTQGKVYAIGKALSIPSNVTFDLNYATLRGYTDKIGKLDSDGLHVSMSNVSNARLRRARIIPPLTPFALGGGDFKAAIVAGAGSMHCIVEDCDIDLTGTSVTEGISFQRADYCTAKGI